MVDVGRFENGFVSHFSTTSQERYAKNVAFLRHTPDSKARECQNPGQNRGV
uniref:Uncharacterized protein n=1 Tax=Candidatus Kentrum sp. FM TaxID=2126340 RepID=A0A450T0R1_9GAMM|nr:MAG: hypothetical protein BECKFM1743C_GA0114222_102642 [Candidatus Kentron sp. FM]VFK13033.1 MAG: hypothetical protein BECKFM1743B_GA0114221_102642 [Candidatus Kentron sp. FM]